MALNIVRPRGFIGRRWNLGGAVDELLGIGIYEGGQVVEPASPRLTEAGDTRVTEAGDRRVTE